MENNQVPPQHNPPPHQEIHPQHIYGYPMEPQWGGPPQQMMFHHLPQQGFPVPPRPLHSGVRMNNFPFVGLTGFVSNSCNSLEAFLGPFPCVKLSGLHHERTMQDVLAFFQGYVVIDIIMFRTNEAFVLFANAMDFQMALQRDRQTMGGHFVEIHPSPRSEYYAAIAEKQWQKQGKPLTQQAQLNNSNEIPELEPQKVAAIVPPNQQQTQWPQSAHQVDPAQPQALIHPQTDTRGKGQGQTVQAGRGGGRPGPTGVSRKIGGGVQVGDHTGFLRMRGLPFSASKENVVEFFKGHKIVPESVVLTYRSDGRATGESYAGFETPEESKAAMALHRSTMGNRYIELFISNKEEHTRAFSRYAGR